MLEGAGLFDADVKAEGGVGDEDPGILLCGFAEEMVHEGVDGEVVELCDALGVVEVLAGVFGGVLLAVGADC